ncbi:MAG: hypothetical protein AAB229_04730 [Candidatus Hydrogenedentota bacterium]
MSQENAQERIIVLLRRILEDKDKHSDRWDAGVALHEGGLGLDSLDTATLSVLLEREFGRDPYTAGVFPGTLGELSAYMEEKRPIA